MKSDMAATVGNILDLPYHVSRLRLRIRCLEPYLDPGDKSGGTVRVYGTDDGCAG